jgi:hypothetical protein
MVEEKKKTDSRGFHIPPYQLRRINNLVSKVVKTLLDESLVLNLDQMNVVLDLSRETINAEIRRDYRDE